MIEGIEKGIEQGIEQGIKKGIKKVAENMLKKGIPIETIAETTGLTGQQIEMLKKKHEG